jgi:hypothetical protein
MIPQHRSRILCGCVIHTIPRGRYSNTVNFASFDDPSLGNILALSTSRERLFPDQQATSSAPQKSPTKGEIHEIQNILFHPHFAIAGDRLVERRR